jgi:hypothetical protein
MTLRPARFIDVPALVEMLCELHPQTIYAPFGDVDRDYARKLLAGMVHRHGGVHNGGTCVFVVEDREGVISGFVAGQLAPVYLVGTRLMAQDIFLIAKPTAPVLTGRALMQAYVEWAQSSPKVVEIFFSRLDVVDGSERIDAHYQRMGFEPCGAMFRRFVNLPEAQRAAA